MKKYVSKDDVEKGLVDPSKPLKEQKEYLIKIEKDREPHVKKDKKDGQKKRERPDRPKFNWNRRDVTEETPIPKEPKKVVEKPDKEKFHNQLNVMKKELEDLYLKKQQVIKDMKRSMKDTHENKRNGQATKSKFFGELKEKKNIRNILSDDIKLLEEKKQEVETELSQNREKIKALRKPDSFQECSTEELKLRLEKIENKLRSEDLDKKEQNIINQKIAEIKRAMQKSKSEIEVTAEASRLEDKCQILYHELKNVREQIDKKYKAYKNAREDLQQVKKQMAKENIDTTENKTPEQVRTEFDKKIEGVKKQIEDTKAKIEKTKDEYFDRLNHYEDYFDLVSFIKMITEEKQKIKLRKQQEERRKKERQDIEKQKQKQFEDRQKKRQERTKREEERKKQDEQRKQKMKKQKEDFINRNPHHEKIEICESLITYCEDLKPQNAERKVQRREQKEYKPIQELKASENKEWEKQIKKGAEVIISKKMKEDVEIPKKIKKEKKKKQDNGEEVTTGFTHHGDISQRFEQVKLLPPLMVGQIDDTIKQLRDRIEIYQKPTEQQIAAFKVKAEKEFDAINGFGDREKKGNFREKRGDDKEIVEVAEQQEAKDKYRGRKNEKKSKPLTENDFPEL